MENNICNSMILTSRRRHFYLVGQSKHKVGACGVNNKASAVLAGKSEIQLSDNLHVIEVDLTYSREQWVGRILYKHEIHRKYGGTDIARIIKASGGWAICTDIPMLFLPKKLIFSKLEGTRRIEDGRWLDDVKNDLKLMGISRWKAIVTSTGGGSGSQPWPAKGC
ncbi:hypothetical protein TNCV_2057991 [Trichonephila clavipes]|nr:hypothetical protein TNCV_2057991 [Trichonephila clavipes]